MLTIILPGYSEHNRNWAEEVAYQMNLGHKVIVHNWKHWVSGSFSLKREIESIIEEIGSERINIIAKSVGVYVALKLIPKIAPQIKKVILCGIASVANEDRKELIDTVLSKIPIKNILCIQNESDKYVTFKEALNFYHSIEPKLNVISKPRNDHSYPYPTDFKIFLE